MGSRQSRTPEQIQGLNEPFLQTNSRCIEKSKTSKYTFRTNSSSSCPICFENFKQNDIMSVNSCYHYWCINCEQKFTSYKCPWCEVNLQPNSFLMANDKTRFSKKTEHEMNCLNIIKEDKDKSKSKIESE
jgi:hypothetical protein